MKNITIFHLKIIFFTSVKYHSILYGRVFVMYKQNLACLTSALCEAKTHSSERKHYANTPMQYTAIFHGCKNYNFQMKNCDVFLILNEAVLTSTHNLCFRAKIRNKVYPCKPQFYFIKVGCKGVFITRTCLHDTNDSDSDTS